MYKGLSVQVYFQQIILVIFLGLSGVLFWANPLRAQTNRLVVAQDTFVDSRQADTNYANLPLEVNYYHAPAFVATRATLLQFDLAAVSGTMEQDEVVLSLLQNNLPATATLQLNLYALPNDWDEKTITANTVPALGNLLQSITVTAELTGPVHFDDATVGAYLEAERTGDGKAAFLLHLAPGNQAPLIDGNLRFAGRTDTANGVTGNEPFIDRLTPALVVEDIPGLVVEAPIMTPGQSADKPDTGQVVAKDTTAMRNTLFLPLIDS